MERACTKRHVLTRRKLGKGKQKEGQAKERKENGKKKKTGEKRIDRLSVKYLDIVKYDYEYA
jgi:hypothetical protein